jgi:hypothetical protein
LHSIVARVTVPRGKVPERLRSGRRTPLRGGVEEEAMNKLRFVLFVGLIALLGIVGPARADDDEDFNRQGPFFGLGASYEIPAFQGVLTGRGVDTWGFNARGGYRFNEFLAAEGLYEYGRFSASASDPASGARASVDVQTNLVMGGGKLILPLERFQPYLWGGFGLLAGSGTVTVIGAGATASDQPSVSGGGFAGRIAAGFDFHVTREIALFGETSYVMPATGPTNLYYVSAGFGGRYVF